MIVSKLTGKGRTTIPQAVRAALGLSAGDEIGYSIEDGSVILTRAVGKPADDPFHSFSEWESEADRLAYADL